MTSTDTAADYQPSDEVAARIAWYASERTKRGLAGNATNAASASYMNGVFDSLARTIAHDTGHVASWASAWLTAAIGVVFESEHGKRWGYVAGDCGHAVAQSEWLAGFRNCERC